MTYSYSNPKILFHGKRINVLSVDAPHPKGGMIEKEVVDHPGAVVILPLLDAETLILIRNERYVVQETLWELPAGTLEKNEAPLTCAYRELEEETGYRAQVMEPLLTVFSTPGFCNEKLYLFLARDLIKTSQTLDETEQIEVEILKIPTAFNMIKGGTICDAKTICALLYYELLCNS